MSELKKNQKIAFNQAELAIEKESKQLLKIYKSSLKEVRSKMLALNEKVQWNFQELNKFDRLQKLENQIVQEIRKITGQTLRVMTRTNTDITINTYNRGWYGYEKEIGASINFGKINPDVVKGIVTDPYPGVKLSDLIKDVGRQGAARIQFEIGQSLVQGEGLRKAASRIKNALNISLNRSITIARTEGLRAQSKASEQSDQRAIDKGIDIINLWDATLDNRTRSTHRNADGKKHDENGDFTVGGVKFTSPRIVSPRNTSGNTAKESILCRCHRETQISDVPETMEARAKKQKKKIGDLTYEQWQKSKDIRTMPLTGNKKSSLKTKTKI